MRLAIFCHVAQASINHCVRVHEESGVIATHFLSGLEFGFYTARDPLVAPAPPGPIRESSGFIAWVRRPLVLDTCLLVAEEAPVPMGNEWRG